MLIWNSNTGKDTVGRRGIYRKVTLSGRATGSQGTSVSQNPELSKALAAGWLHQVLGHLEEWALHVLWGMGGN